MIIQDFELIKVIGEGAYGQVYLAKPKSVRQITEEGGPPAISEIERTCAIKVLKKSHVIRYEKHDCVMREKEILLHLSKEGGHPGVVKLETTFQVRQILDRLYY